MLTAVPAVSIQHQHSSLSSLFLKKMCLAISSMGNEQKICHIHSRAAPYLFINICAFD